MSMSASRVSDDDFTPPSTPRLDILPGTTHEMDDFAASSSGVNPKPLTAPGGGNDPYSVDERVTEVSGCSLSRTYCCTGEKEGCSWRRAACCFGLILCGAGAGGAGYYYLVAAKAADAIFAGILGIGGGGSTCLFGTQQPLDGVVKGTKEQNAEYRRGLAEQRRLNDREAELLKTFQEERRAEELHFQTQVADLKAICNRMSAKVESLKDKLETARGEIVVLNSAIATFEKHIDEWNSKQDMTDRRIDTVLSGLEAGQKTQIKMDRTNQDILDKIMTERDHLADQIESRGELVTDWVDEVTTKLGRTQALAQVKAERLEELRAANDELEKKRAELQEISDNMEAELDEFRQDQQNLMGLHKMLFEHFTRVAETYGKEHGSEAEKSAWVIKTHLEELSKAFTNND